MRTAMADYTLPNLGEDIEEADVLKVLVAEGDHVDVDTPLLEIETEKSTLDVPAEAAGTVSTVHVAAGDPTKVRKLMITIDAGRGAPAPAPAETDSPPAAPNPAAPPDAEPAQTGR